MACYGLIPFFGLVFLSFQCEGKINPPSSGNSLVVSPGSTVSINWTFTDDPTQSTLEWYFIPGDGSSEQLLAVKYPRSKAQIQSSSSLTRVTVEDPGTLVLTNVDQNYNGTYKLVTKVAGVPNNAKSLIDVLIAERPTAVLNCSSLVKLNQESNFACSCRAENGNPPASATWYNEDEVELVHGYDEQTLILKNVSGKDSGTYTCVARSYTLSDNKSIEVMVILNYKPNVASVTFEPKEAVLGKPFVVSCVSNGLPEPVYSIFLNGSLVSSEGPHRIPKVEWKDAGIYRCDARNKLGSHSGSASLTVVDPIPPTVLSFTSIPKKTLLGESVLITCEALAVPLPRYTIIHNDTVVVSTHKTYIITVSKYSQAGSYKCIATNQFGTSSQTFNLSVVELPTTKIPDTKSKASAKDITAAWYIILVLLLAGFTIGCIFSIIIYHSRRKIQSRKTQSNPESPNTTSRVDSTYQELDLRKMNLEENYQSLAGNAAARNNVGDGCDNSTYTELNTSRDEGNNYQSLT